MDEKYFEVAESLSARAVEEAVRRIRNSKQERPMNFAGECSCGEQVPEARIALGYYRCVTCQSRLERRR